MQCSLSTFVEREGAPQGREGEVTLQFPSMRLFKLLRGGDVRRPGEGCRRQAVG